MLIEATFEATKQFVEERGRRRGRSTTKLLTFAFCRHESTLNYYKL
jgi:hypothetical protein